MRVLKFEMSDTGEFRYKFFSQENGYTYVEQSDLAPNVSIAEVIEAKVEMFLDLPESGKSEKNRKKSKKRAEK